MNQKELKELIEFIIEKDIAEFELERGDMKLRLKRAGAEPAIDPRLLAAPPSQAVAAPSGGAAGVTAAPASSAAAAAPASASVDTAEEAGLHIVRSPIVGTFYESASPGAPPFVKAGDNVAVGQVLCIIEAMKLMNEIEADFAGELVTRYVSNAQPVEYGQPLFALRAQ